MSDRFVIARQATRRRIEVQHAALHPVVCQLRGRGLTLDQVAGVLQRLNCRTLHGGRWTKIQVWRLQKPLPSAKTEAA